MLKNSCDILLTPMSKIDSRVSVKDGLPRCNFVYLLFVLSKTDEIMHIVLLLITLSNVIKKKSFLNEVKRLADRTSL